MYLDRYDVLVQDIKPVVISLNVNGLKAIEVREHIHFLIFYDFK